MSRALLRVVGALVGVLMFDVLLTLPATALLFGFFWCLQRMLGRLDGVAQIVWNLTVIFSMAGLFAFGSLLGFVVSWRVGGRIAAGVPLTHSLASSRVLNAIARALPFVRSIRARATRAARC